MLVNHRSLQKFV